MPPAGNDDLPEFDEAPLADIAASLPAAQLTQFLGDYLASGEKHIERLQAFHAAGDMAALGAEAHTLVSTTGSYGLKRASAIARQLETACKAGLTDDVPALVDMLASASRRGWEALRRRFLASPT
ncbi:MAG: Hpt domain-containing protein [Alphaproteobacteria bacterium]|nr:Hpt domain-containing protein [Alphaproteobacteria bacterium]